MTKRRPVVKRTKEELARSIIQDGTLMRSKSTWNTITRYYEAYGQLWALTHTESGLVKSVEQVNENYERISL